MNKWVTVSTGSPNWQFGYLHGDRDGWDRRGPRFRRCPFPFNPQTEVQDDINEAVEDVREATERLTKTLKARDDHIKYTLFGVT
jgi:hypothetical protein